MKTAHRVLMVISNFHPRVGGTERQCLRLCKGLRARGLDARVLTFQQQPDWALQEEVEGVPVRRIPLTGAAFKGKTEALLFYHLWRYARHADVIHNHIVSTYTAVCTAVGKLRNRPVVVKFANSGARNDLHLARQRLPALMARRVTRAVMAADACVAICSAVYEELRAEGIPAEHIASIPNGVEVDRFMPAGAAERRKHRRQLGFPDEAGIILRVGSFMAKKGTAVLLEAWKHVAAQHPAAFLVSVGGRPEETQVLARTWKHRARFVPTVDDVLPYYQAADVFVLPSFSEGLSNALLEAQACGIPSVATRVGGNTDIIEAQRNGLLVAPGDAAALAEALGSLIANPSARATMSREAVTMSRRFAMPRVVEHYAALYEHLLQGESPRRIA